MSLGGVQTSVRLQRKFLARAGVEVTVFAPKSANALPDDDTIVLPSRRLSPDGEYSAVWDMEEAYEVAEAIFAQQKFDLIHLQGDFAAAAISLALAKKHNIPLIHHAHTNIDVVLERIIGNADRAQARLLRDSGEQMPGKRGNIAGAFAQGRDRHLDDVQAVI